jgi:nicotinamidase-related amidase
VNLEKEGKVMLLRAERGFLGVVDVQDRLAPAMATGEAAIARCGILMRAAARLGVPILVSEQYPKGLGRTVPTLAELVAPDAVVEKIHFSCADEPDWIARVEALGDAGRDQAVLCGIEAHVCVLQTALGLREKGYRVAVAADAVSSRRAEDAGLALARMQQAGITVVSTEMVVFEWLRRAGSAEFKELSALIK